MRVAFLRTVVAEHVWRQFVGFALLVCAGGAASAAPYVEFDFARTAECRDVTQTCRGEEYPNARVVKVTIPISVRFRGLTADDVEELDIEINGSMAGLYVQDFCPTTQLASDVARPIESTITTKKDHSLDASLGGALPVPYATLVAHVTPTINAGTTRSQTATEKMDRLPPMQPIVVSGTISEGRGVFFKIKRSSQTSLEGVHELSVSFVVPKRWEGSAVRVACSAGGQRKIMWMKQPATVGGTTRDVQLYLVGDLGMQEAAQHRAVAKPVEPRRPPSLFEAAAEEMIDIVDVTRSNSAGREHAKADNRLGS